MHRAVLPKHRTDPILPTRAFAVIRIVLRPQDCNSDFILIILKQLLAYTRPDLRLVLMSATVEVPSHPLAIHPRASMP